MRDTRPVTRTSFSREDYAAALRFAAPALSRSAAGVLWAQYALETGRGAACWNSNIGNVKVTRGQADAGVPFFMLPGTTEYIGGKVHTFQPPHEQTWFRHFDSLADGMKHHVAFLQNKRYAPAWPFVVAGDPTPFALELGRLGYYTGPTQVYAGSMRHLHAEWMREVEWPEIGVDPNEVSIGGTDHGTHVVDWVLEQRETDRRAKLDAEHFAIGETMFVGMGRVDE